MITVSTDRTAAGLRLEKRLEGRTDSELEVVTMYSTKSLPPNSREPGVFCYLSEGGQNVRPNLPETIFFPFFFPRQCCVHMGFVGS